MAIDPICGMTVDERTGLSAERNGEKLCFCSEHCRRKFLDGDSKAHTAHGPQLVTLSAGGVASHSRPTFSASSAAIYTCPMHPEIEQDHPGTCPKCGMALEPKTVTAGAEDDTELRDMTQRFWASIVLGIPILVVAMLPMLRVPVN